MNVRDFQPNYCYPPAICTAVHDGDTFDVAELKLPLWNAEQYWRVRLHDVWAPELHDVGGIESRDELATLVQGQPVYLRTLKRARSTDVQTTFDRIVCEVGVSPDGDGNLVDVNQTMREWLAQQGYGPGTT